jgi:hypothetical protein
MPRPKHKTGSPTWVAHSHGLSEGTKKKLIDLLGLESSSPTHAEQIEKAIRKVEYWLGFYPGGIQALDNAPRAADYRVEITSVQKQAIGLLNKLHGLNQWMCDVLDVHGAKVDDLDLPLIALIDSTTKALSAIPNKENRGQPKRLASKKVIGELRRIFESYYIAGESERNTSGACDPLSEKEADEVEFLKTALADANIPCPDNIRRYFDDPEVALPTERNQVIKKIAQKVQKNYKDKC